ncbi:fimbrial protein [Burkholderia sp. AU15512]|uniref:fimbrial protein n=1 Tax=Burkholderia sp. AU15512 TaxID=2015345 RepID=UPI000B7AE466|nr:fimbrial protein [Burkholderia sp. AU15512]OXI18974.1 fimbrial protein [Burkholderia sp. AU15512]
MNNLAKFSLMLLASILPFSAHAASDCTADTTDGKDYYIVHVSGFNPPPFSPSAVPIGGIIYEAKGVRLKFANAKFPDSPTTRCKRPINNYASGVGTVGANNIYPTNIPNVGIRILDPNRMVPYPFADPGVWWNVASWSTDYVPIIQLIKTGNITEGGVLSGAYAEYRYRGSDGQTMVSFQYANPVLVTPKVPTCNVTTPAISVPMGTTLATKTFTGVGSTAPAQHFSINLACSGGDAGTAVNIYATLTDVTTPANRSSMLSLSSTSTATGVGIQILKDDTVLSYGPDSSALDNPNRWFAGKVRQGETGLTIPLQARYVQTESEITPGSANANASFTMSYQ